MRVFWPVSLISAFTFFLNASLIVAQAPPDQTFARDPRHAVDQLYTDHILKYTTEPRFLSPLVNYLPASNTVPTPSKVLGDVAGAPDMLPYAEDVYNTFVFSRNPPTV